MYEKLIKTTTEYEYESEKYKIQVLKDDKKTVVTCWSKENELLYNICDSDIDELIALKEAIDTSIQILKNHL